MAILGNISFAEYEKLEGEHWSVLKSAAVSPLQYKYDSEHKKTLTDAMELGIVAHCAVFEPTRLPLRCVVWDGGDRRGKDWQAFKAANEGRSILKAKDYAHVEGMRDAVRNHPIAGRYVCDGEAEIAITWTDPSTGLKCKARLDFVTTENVLVELKTTNNIASALFGAVAARFGYATQMAGYGWGWSMNNQPPFAGHKIIAVQATPPYDVAVFDVGAELIGNGEGEWAKLLGLVAECRARDCWPGMYQHEMPLVLPKWATGEDDTELELDGEMVRL
ncbi:MAG: PD-(D/E)XK nuclease-like domain-containing protein [Acidobacteriota bacterium]|nr:PD-(D/E)XK nuclease-like domain-containing protein [Acidobacteriota bacterium]